MEENKIELKEARELLKILAKKTAEIRNLSSPGKKKALQRSVSEIEVEERNKMERVEKEKAVGKKTYIRT